MAHDGKEHKHPYRPMKAILCSIVGHDMLAYDFGVDKCLRCNKEVVGYGGHINTMISRIVGRTNDN